MDENLAAEEAQRAMMEVVAGGDEWPPLDQVLDGPALRITFTDVPLAMRLGKNSNGKLICTGLLVGWDYSQAEVTSRTLRDLRLQQILHEIGRLAEGADERPRAAELAPGEEYPPEHYRQVANLYRAAVLARPGAPNRWVAEHLGVSVQRVQRWLTRCRDRGLL